MKLRFVVSSALGLAVHFGGLFGAAGTFRWPQAWIFILIMLLLSTAMRLRLARVSPDLLRERQGSPLRAGQATWDKVFEMAFLPAYLGWMILMGLDAARLQWSHVPIWLQVIGGVLLCAAFPCFYWIFRENAFAIPIVRIQKERGHHVITTGPYSIVRHPMYVCMLVFLPSVALLLGSYCGLIGAGLLGSLLIVRTALEDRMLQRELDGYREYARKVRYRLLPAVW